MISHQGVVLLDVRAIKCLPREATYADKRKLLLAAGLKVSKELAIIYRGQIDAEKGFVSWYLVPEMQVAEAFDIK